MSIPSVARDGALAGVHPALATKEPSQWTQRNSCKQLLSHEQAFLWEQIENTPDTTITQVETNQKNGVPFVSVRLSDTTFTRDSPLGDTITHVGAELHGFSLLDSDEIVIDILPCPEFLVGSLCKISANSTEPLSKHITITGALNRAGIGVDESVHMAVRDNEVRLWPAESRAPLYRGACSLIRQAFGHDEKLGAVERLEKRLVSLKSVEFEADISSTPPTVTIHCSSDEFPLLEHWLATSPISVQLVEMSESTVTVTCRVNRWFTEVTSGHHSPKAQIRKQNDRSYVVTLTSALEAAGLSKNGEKDPEHMRVTTFSRPGELRIVPGANRGPIHSDLSHE